jgi:hypothetical protein
MSRSQDPEDPGVLVLSRFAGAAGLGHLHDMQVRRVAFGIDLDVDRDRGAPDALDLRVEAQQIANGHRLFEDELVHRDGHQPALGDARR